MNMKALMQQAQQMQKKIKQAEDEFLLKEFDFEQQGIKIKIKGDLSISSISIDEDLIDVDSKDMLEDMISLAVNSSVKEVLAQKESTLSQQTGGFGMPGMF